MWALRSDTCCVEQWQRLAQPAAVGLRCSGRQTFANPTMWGLMSGMFCRPGQRPPPHQVGSSLQDRLSAPLGAMRAAQWPPGQGGPAQGALMRAGESAEELRMKEERLEQERAAQRKKEAEAKRKAEVRCKMSSDRSVLLACT